MKLPTPIGLLPEPGVIGQILRKVPRIVLEEAEKQDDPWTWLAKRVKETPGNGRGKNVYHKTFAAAASQKVAFLRLSTIARGGGSIAGTWRLKMREAQRRGDQKMADHFARKEMESILQWERGRKWLLENKHKGLNATPEMREIAQRKYDAFYIADVRRMGRKKADEKWKSAKKPQVKMKANDGDYIALAMTMEWLTVGNNGFPGLCFISDNVLAKILGEGLPVPSLYEKPAGWKTIRTIRERIGLKKAEIIFTGIEKVGEKKWAILNRQGKKAYSIALLPKKPLPPEL